LSRPISPAPILVAIDLGSNSFHLLACRWQEGQLLEIARDKQMVQLARGLDQHGNLCPAARQRALTCLQSFQQQWRQFSGARVSVIATEVFRRANRHQNFLSQAEQALGLPIRLISGDEEARLSYRGVDFSHPQIRRKMVVDIGGASTEFVLGQDGQLLHAVSMALGCVTLADQHFQSRERISALAFEDANSCALETLSTLPEPFRQVSAWEQALGASGSMRIILDLIGSDTATIQQAHLSEYIQAMLEKGELPAHLGEHLRWDVIPAALAILDAIFTHFQLPDMLISSTSIKEGLMLETMENPQLSTSNGKGPTP
jgi:exopolyphosphatase/guanosine-5'-triphosphate,3'-diphosphate pyrophosphatase